MITRKMLTYLTIASVLLLCLYRGIQIYNAAKPPVITTLPTGEPTPQKLTYSLTFTREVKVDSKK